MYIEDVKKIMIRNNKYKFYELLELKQNFSILKRSISVNKPINYKIGQELKEVGESWADIKDPNYKKYDSSIYGKIEYNFIVYNIKGFKVPYLEDNKEKWYKKFLWMLNTSVALNHEAEVLLNNDLVFKIIYIKDNNIILQLVIKQDQYINYKIISIFIFYKLIIIKIAYNKKEP